MKKIHFIIVVFLTMIISASAFSEEDSVIVKYTFNDGDECNIKMEMSGNILMEMSFGLSSILDETITPDKAFKDNKTDKKTKSKSKLKQKPVPKSPAKPDFSMNVEMGLLSHGRYYVVEQDGLKRVTSITDDFLLESTIDGVKQSIYADKDGVKMEPKESTAVSVDDINKALILIGKPVTMLMDKDDKVLGYEKSEDIPDKFIEQVFAMINSPFPDKPIKVGEIIELEYNPMSMLSQLNPEQQATGKGTMRLKLSSLTTNDVGHKIAFFTGDMGDISTFAGSLPNFNNDMIVYSKITMAYNSTTRKVGDTELKMYMKEREKPGGAPMKMRMNMNFKISNEYK